VRIDEELMEIWPNEVCDSVARMRGNDVQAWRTTREVHSENIIWMVGQAIQPGILGKIIKELETMEGQETSKKRDDEDDSERGRN